MDMQRREADTQGSALDDNAHLTIAVSITTIVLMLLLMLSTA